MSVAEAYTSLSRERKREKSSSCTHEALSKESGELTRIIGGHQTVNNKKESIALGTAIY